MEIDKSKTHILVVDDEPEVHTMLGKILRHDGYSVDNAYGGKQAFELISKKKPDLIVLDIMMPKISGIEVCNQVKGNPETSNVLVLIVSARDEQADRITGLEHGADDYVSKPFHLRSLLRKIEHMLQKQAENNFTKEIS